MRLFSEFRRCVIAQVWIHTITIPRLEIHLNILYMRTGTYSDQTPKMFRFTVFPLMSYLFLFGYLYVSGFLFFDIVFYL